MIGANSPINFNAAYQLLLGSLKLRASLNLCTLYHDQHISVKYLALQSVHLANIGAILASSLPGTLALVAAEWRE